MKVIPVIYDLTRPSNQQITTATNSTVAFGVKVTKDGVVQEADTINAFIGDQQLEEQEELLDGFVVFKRDNPGTPTTDDIRVVYTNGGITQDFRLIYVVKDKNAFFVNAGGGGEYVLPTASATVKGGIKVGANLAIDANGVLSAAGGGSGSPVWGTITGEITDQEDLSAYVYEAKKDAMSYTDEMVYPCLTSEAEFNSWLSGDNVRAGNGSTAGTYSVAIGKDANSSGSASQAIGRNAKASGSQAVGVGLSAEAGGNNSIAIGREAKTSATDTIQIGTGTNSTAGDFQVWNLPVLNKNVGTIKPERLPKANATDLGCVKISGNNLEILADGTLSAAPGGGGSYTLPVATDAVLGGVKIGSNMRADANGVLSCNEEDPVFTAWKNGSNIIAGSSASIQGSTSGAVVIGSGAKNTGFGGGVSIGNYAEVKSSNGIAIGSGCKANNNNGIAIGYDCQANGNCVAIGYQATNTQSFSIAIGSAAKTTVIDGIQIGNGTVSVQGNFQVWSYPIMNMSDGYFKPERLGTGYDATKTQVLKNVQGTLTWVDEA